MLNTAEMVRFTERLLAEIREFPVLYERKSSRFKDAVERDDAWVALVERLPKDLNITVSEAKRRWRTLKDCYAKYLRADTSTKRLEIRYRSWKWSNEMEFFKPHMLQSIEMTPGVKKRKPHNMKSLEGIGRPNNDITKHEKYEEYNEASNDDDNLMTTKSNIVKGELMAEYEIEEDEMLGDDDVDEDAYQSMADAVSGYADPQSQDAWEQTINEPTQQNASNASTNNARRATTTAIATMEPSSSMDPLMVGREFDSIDLTFLGYANSIKKLSARRQTLIKFSVAKLIMQAELEEQSETDGAKKRRLRVMK